MTIQEPKEKEYKEFEGIVNDCQKKSDKAPLNIVIQTKKQKINLTAWNTLGDQLQKDIMEGDHIYCKVWDNKGKDDYKSKFYQEEVMCYNLHADTNLLIVNEKTLLEMDPKQFEKNIQAFKNKEILQDKQETSLKIKIASLTLKYEKTFNLGNYESQKIGLFVEIIPESNQNIDDLINAEFLFLKHKVTELAQK